MSAFVADALRDRLSRTQALAELAGRILDSSALPVTIVDNLDESRAKAIGRLGGPQAAAHAIACAHERGWSLLTADPAPYTIYEHTGVARTVNLVGPDAVLVADGEPGEVPGLRTGDLRLFVSGQRVGGHGGQRMPAGEYGLRAGQVQGSAGAGERGTQLGGKTVLVAGGILGQGRADRRAGSLDHHHRHRHHQPSMAPPTDTARDWGPNGAPRGGEQPLPQMVETALPHGTAGTEIGGEYQPLITTANST